jgi:hypothetical protein
MVFKSQVVAQVSQALLDELTERGTRDLTTMRLSDIEDEVYGLVDSVSQRLVRGLLEDQASQDQVQTCPCCDGPLHDKPPEEKSLLLRRGDVAWQQPVKRCGACRRDFFPSGEAVGD